MQNGIHFISGLPRSGSTLLAALLRQNPRFSAGMTSPVGSLFNAMLSATSRATRPPCSSTTTSASACCGRVFRCVLRRHLARPRSCSTPIAVDHQATRADPVVPGGPGHLLRAQSSLGGRQHREPDSSQCLRTVRHLQFRTRRHGLFPRRGSDQGRRHGRLRLECAARGGVRPAGRPAAAGALRNADRQPAWRPGRDLPRHRRTAVRA